LQLALAQMKLHGVDEAYFAPSRQLVPLGYGQAPELALTLGRHNVLRSFKIARGIKPGLRGLAASEQAER
jgi:hypothetical protein